jgi:hypothetical protein
MLSNSLKNISAHSDAFSYQVVGKPRLLPLLLNEWRFYRVQPLLWLALLLALAFAALTTLGNDVQTAQPHKELLFTHTKLLMILQVLLIGVLAPLAFLRDRQHGMTELTGVTPLTDWHWCCSRAGGLLVLVLGVQILLQFLAIAGVWFGINPQATAVTLASLCWISLQLFLLQQLPALLLLVALQLWCSRKTPHPALLYLLTAVCWLGYVLLAAATGSPVMAKSQPVSPWLSQLMLYLDPYALTPWLVQLQSSASINPDATVLLNRLLIVGISALLFWRAWATRPSLSKLRSGKLQFRTATDPAPAIQDSHLFSSHLFNGSYSGQPQTTDFRTVTPTSANWQSFVSLLRLQWLQLLRQRSTILALLILTGLVFSEVFTGLGYAEALSRLQPDSRDALNRINWDVLPRFGLLLLAFWASQLSWLNRQLRFDSLIAATPVSGVVQLCSQLAVLWSLTLFMVVLSFSAVALAQLLAQIPIQFAEYLQQAQLTLIPLLLWAMLLLACHALLRLPLLANLMVAVLLLLGLSQLPEMLELQHPLWRVGQTMLEMPDALWGYQGSVGGAFASHSATGNFNNGGFWPYLTFWGLLALTLWLLALQGYHRGTGYSHLKLRLNQPTILASLVLALLWLTQGLHIHQHLQQAGALETAPQRQAQRAAYERQYQQWQHQPQPVVSKVQLQVELFPAAQQASIAATLTLTNPHPTPITQLLVTLPGDIADQQALQSIDLDGAQLVSHQITQPIPQKTEHQQRIYQFDQPLASGATTQLIVNLQLAQHAIAPAPMHQVLRSEFSYLRLLHLLPQVGFMPDLRLRDAKTRAEFGLAPLPAAETQPSVLAAEGTPANARYDWAKLETIISVPQGYQGIAAGKLIRQWQEQNRQYFHYQTTDAVRNLPAVIAVPWQPQQSTQDGVTLEIYSPAYNAATELNMQAMQQTLHWFSTHVGAYPGDALRLVMMPDVGPTGYALPQLVLINHRVGVRAVAAPDAGFSQVYRRAVHEVAHQWFGHGIGNGVPGDGAFLVESLAKYVELVLIEQHFGTDAMQALVDFEQQRYSRALAGSRSEQKSLVDADESYDQYSRATLVFAKLRATVGDAVITAALRQLWQQHRYPATPASAMDFVRALQAHSPQSAQPLIHSLLLTKDSSLLVD